MICKREKVFVLFRERRRSGYGRQSSCSSPPFPSSFAHCFVRHFHHTQGATEIISFLPEFRPCTDALICTALFFAFGTFISVVVDIIKKEVS